MKIRTTPMQATRPMTYGTRRLVAGDTFDCARTDVGTVAAVFGAVVVTDPAPAPAVPGAPAPKATPPTSKGRASRKANKAAKAGKPVRILHDEPDPQEAVPGSGLDQLRADYLDLVGEPAPAEWGAGQIAAEIEAKLAGEPSA